MHAAPELAIAVLLPCYNEEQTIGDVVRRLPRGAADGRDLCLRQQFQRSHGAASARAAGAIVVREPRQGKGNVVRRMFADIDADIYLMADGDGTYAPEDAPQLINTLLTERSDMVVGTRRGVTDDAGRAGHAFGNRIFNGLYKRAVRPRLHRHLLRLPRLHAPLRQELSGRFRRLRDRDRNVGARLAAEAAGQRDARSTMAAGPEGSSSKLSTYQGRRKDPVDVRHADEGDAAAALLRRLRRLSSCCVEPRADDAGAGRISSRPAWCRACRPGCCRSACCSCRC